MTCQADSNHSRIKKNHFTWLSKKRYNGHLSIVVIIIGILFTSVAIFSPIVADFELNFLEDSKAESLSQEINKFFEQDWYIDANNTVNLTNQTIILNGNLIINSTGALKLFNVTLILNNTNNDANDIILNPLAKLILENCSIKTSVSSQEATINLKNNSIAEFRGTQFSNLGQDLNISVNGEFFTGAILSESDNLLVMDCVIEGSDCGIYLEKSSPSIQNVLFKNCDLGVIGEESNAKLVNCTFNLTSVDMMLTNGSNITVIDTNIQDPSLESGSVLISKRSLKIFAGFRTPYIKPIVGADILIINNDLVLYGTAVFGGTDPQTDGLGVIPILNVTQAYFNGGSIYNITTNVSVEYHSRAEINHTVEFEPLTQGTELLEFYFDNDLPILTQPTLTPWSGNTDTEFNYSVKYLDLDNDRPSIIQVEIDGIKYNMTKSNSNSSSEEDEDIWINGVRYEFKSKLDAGEHKFRFITNDVLSFGDVIAPTGSVSYLTGPFVEEQNHNPELSSGLVVPMTGKPNTEFTYKVKYNDKNGDMAVIAKVYIDNIPHKMVAVTGESITNITGIGVWYEYKTKLTLGDHNFFFKFKDRNNSDLVHWPAANGENIIEQSGPVVLDFENQRPIIGNGTVTPKLGNRLSLYSYTISYYDVEGDTPTQAVVVIDGEPFNLTRARIAQDKYFFEEFLPLGQHTFHFEFLDEVNHHFVRYPENDGVDIIGPTVVDLPPYLWSGSVEPNSGTPDTDFIFNIFYKDLENDQPLESKVIIDNNSYELQVISNLQVEINTDNQSVKSLIMKNIQNNSDNEQSSVVIGSEVDDLGNNSYADYQVKTWLMYLPLKLKPGNHSYYFILKSGYYTLRYPKSGFINGPQILIKNDNEIENVTDSNKDNTPNGSDIKNENDNGSTNNIEDSDNRTSNDQDDKDNNDFPDEISISDFKLIVINYSGKTIAGFPENIYNFTVICKARSEIEQNFEINCCLYLDNEAIVMSLSRKYENGTNLYIFSKVLVLTSGDHYYHFVLTSLNENNQSELRARLPFKGEFIIIIQDPQQDSNNDSVDLDEVLTEQKNDILRILFIILIIIIMAYFLFYRKYQNLIHKGSYKD